MTCIEKYNEQKNITNKIIVNLNKAKKRLYKEYNRAKEDLYNGTRQSDYEVTA